MTTLESVQKINRSSNTLSIYLSEQFKFVSQRHRGYPFSATLYVNGIMVARISSCCEYRYAPGFQQGRKSCFRLTRLAGGLPCYRLDFILCETDSVSLAENRTLVPVKTDLQHFFNFFLLDVQVSETNTAPASSWTTAQRKA